MCSAIREDDMGIRVRDFKEMIEINNGKSLHSHPPMSA
jgi:hypothetical protein